MLLNCNKLLLNLKPRIFSDKSIKFLFNNSSKALFGSKINFRLLNKEKKEILKKEEELKKIKKLDQKSVVSSTKYAYRKIFYTSPIEALKFIRDEAKEKAKQIPVSSTTSETTDKKSNSQTIVMFVALGVEPNKADHLVRGICKFPGGSIKIPKVCVFTSGHLIDVAKEAGADFIGDEAIMEEIKLGKFKFDKLICSLDMLPTLKQFGKVLGPKGLMPNVKVGTASKAENLEGVIKDLKTGSKEFKVDKSGQVAIPVGKESFTNENIYKNIDAFLQVLIEKRPENVKSNYIRRVFLRTDNGKPVNVDIKSLDMKSPSYFLNHIHENPEQEKVNEEIIQKNSSQSVQA